MLVGRLEAQIFSTLHSFNGNDGASPQGGLVVSGDTLYGTTSGGGSQSNGVLFSIKTDGTGLVILHSFTAVSNSTNADGANPNGGLVLSGNTLYGTASACGPVGGGTVFAVNTDGTGFKPLLFFNNYPPGRFVTGTFPSSGMALSGNTLYGTTPYGGSTCETTVGYGQVFAINTDGSGFAVPHSFRTNGACSVDYPIINNDGAMPFAGLIVGGKTLYGTASMGGTEGNGTVFAVNTDGSDFVTLHNFTNIDGANPNGGLVLSDKTLYGTTPAGGGSGGGTVFKISLPLPPPPPVLKLAIILSGPNAILTWPTNFAGYSLQSATNLASPVWNMNLSPAVVVNGQYTVTNPVSATQQFFRLSPQFSCTTNDGTVTIILVYQYPGLLDVTIPDTFNGLRVTGIGVGAPVFNYPSNVTHVTIGNNVTNIGAGAFSDSGLTNVTIPDRVITIGDDAFANCSALTDVTIANGVSTIGADAFAFCPLKTITIPGSVTNIGNDSFNSCQSLTNVTIGSGVMSIGSSAFSDCRSLKNVTIPGSVTTIADHAFFTCGSLTSVLVPEGVVTIGGSAFAYTSITSLMLPNRVYLVGSSFPNWNNRKSPFPTMLPDQSLERLSHLS